MSAPVDLARLPPARRAELILATARAEMADRLWRSALHGGEEALPRPSAPATTLAGMTLNALLATLDFAPKPLETPAPRETLVSSPLPQAKDAPAGLGANAAHGPALDRASARTGIPVATLAAMIDAEAARGPDGAWNPRSRNPRSSAAGLGQFLAGTWLDMARQKGSWLNETARARGWLDAGGQPQRDAREALLALRFDAAASIETTADFARANLARLRAAGVPVNDDPASLARAAYLGHHLGAGDAVRFYSGTIGPERARALLVAQIGPGRAAQAIAQTGDASQAHRQWLLAYVAKAVRPQRYLA